VVIEELDEEYRSEEDDLCDFGNLAAEMENSPEDDFEGLR
jgi:hypothetical protein